MPSTTTKTVPYPVTTDNNANTVDMQNLAQWIDDSLGPFTTTQRNALAAALKWVGREIYNSTTKQFEWWDGTNWQVRGFVRGEYKWMPYDMTTPPVGWLQCFGQAVSRTTFADLFALISTNYGAGDGSTTFNVPDGRGRTLAGMDNMGGSDAGRLASANTFGTAVGVETVTLGSTQVPLVNHDHGGITGVGNVDHSHTYSFTTGTESADHGHSLSGCFTDAAGNHNHGSSLGGFFVTDGFGGGSAGLPSGAGTGLQYDGATSFAGNHAHNVFGGTGGRNAAHTHSGSGTTSGFNTNHQHAITAASAVASAAVNLMQPTLMAHLIIKY